MTWEDILKNSRRNIKIPKRPQKDDRKYTPSAPAFVDRKAPPKPKELPKIYSSFVNRLISSAKIRESFMGYADAYVNMRDKGKYEKNVHYSLPPDLNLEEILESRDYRLKEMVEAEEEVKKLKEDFKNLSKEEKEVLPKQKYLDKLEEVFLERVHSAHPNRGRMWKYASKEFLEIIKW